MMPYFVYVILAFTNLIPALIGGLFFKRFPKSLKYIAILMIFSFLTELSSFIITTIQGAINNLYIIHIYSCIEVILLTLYFRSVIINKKIGSLLRSFCVVVIVVIIIESIFTGTNWWNSFSTVLEGVLIIFAAFYYYYEVATAVNQEPIPQSPYYWITGAIMLYFTSSLQFFLLSQYLSNKHEILLFLGNIHAFINAFCNLSYGVILWILIRSHRLAQL